MCQLWTKGTRLACCRDDVCFWEVSLLHEERLHFALACTTCSFCSFGVASGFSRIFATDMCTDFQIRQSMFKGNGNNCLPQYSTITQRSRQRCIHSLHNNTPWAPPSLLQRFNKTLYIGLLQSAWVFVLNHSSKDCHKNPNAYTQKLVFTQGHVAHFLSFTLTMYCTQWLNKT